MSRRVSVGGALLAAPAVQNHTDDNDDEDDEQKYKSIAVRKSIGGGRRSIGGPARRRSSFGGNVLGTENTPPSTAETSAAIKEMYAKINDIIQLSSENKITSKNAWNVGVSVDSLLDTALDEGIVEDKEGEKEKTRSGAEVIRRRRSGGFGRAGVNFQKASCKLDASVKIYSARVDDTHDRSYRVLETLTRTGQSDAERAADQDGDKPKGHAVVGEKSTSNKYSLATTLEKVPGSLNAPPVAELQVDPSFYKMSSLFDEGGAQGMLLYNLSLEPDMGCRIAFGDSHAAGTTPSEEAKAAAAAGDCSSSSAAAVDVSGLVARLARAVEELGASSLAGLALCPRLEGLRAETAAVLSAQGQDGFPAPSLDAAAASPADKGADKGAPASPGGLGDQGDWCADDDSNGEDNGEAGDLNMYFDDDDGGGEDNYGGGDDDTLGPGGASSSKPSVPRAMGGRGGNGSAAVLESAFGGLSESFTSDYAFFDSAGASNLWAGAAHWKFGRREKAKRPNKPPAEAADSNADDAAGGADPADAAGSKAKKQRKGAKKAADVAVDFVALPDAEDEAKLVAKVALLVAPPKAKAASSAKAKHAAALKASEATMLTAAAVAKTAGSAGRKACSIPDDAGVSPVDLGRLFLRPCARVARGMGGGTYLSGGCGFAEEPLVAFHAFAAQAGGHFPRSPGGNDQDHGGGNDYDAANDDSFGDCDDTGGRGFLMASTTYAAAGSGDGADFDSGRLLAPDRKVEKIVVRHATTSKKVDVKELKHMIWNDLSVLVPESGYAAAGKAGTKTSSSSSTSFAEVVANVEAEQNDQEGVTCSYYFICVLHLANEHGLKLEGMDDLSNFTITATE